MFRMNIFARSGSVLAIALMVANGQTAWGQCGLASRVSSNTALDNGGGHIVRSDGDVAVIGTPGDNANGLASGSARVFRFNGTTWVEEAKLVASDGAANDRFGASVAIGGDVIAVAAHRNDCPNGVDCGAVYVFRYDGLSWIEEAKVTVRDPTCAHDFGQSLSMRGETIIVGATTGEDGTEQAQTFRFDGTGWTQAVEPLLGTEQADSSGLWGGGTEDTDQGDSLREEESLLGIDIQPGLCPNPLHLQSREVLLVAVVGTRRAGVAEVDLGSLMLARTDGLGEPVIPLGRTPLAGSLEPDIRIEDVATPFFGKLCECHDATGDGTKDLVLRFSTSELVARLELDTLRRNTAVALTLTGLLIDGTEFEASDCIVISGQDAPPIMKRRKRDR